MTHAIDFGPLIVETDIDAAVVGQMRLWMPTHLSKIANERGMDRGYLQRPKPKDYANTLDEDEFKDHDFPAIIVTTAATTGDPTTDGNGFYYAAWQVVVSAITKGRDPAETRGLAALYGGAVKRIMLAQQDLGGIAAELKWVRGNVAPVADPTDTAGRYLAAAINQFTVFVDQVVQEGVGPMSPDPDENPYDPADPDLPDEPYDPLAEVRAVTFDLLARAPHDQE